MYNQIIQEIKGYASPEYAEWFKPFLSIKNDKDDMLLGIKVAPLRKIAKKYKSIDEKTLIKLLRNKYHEVRQVAVFIMLIKVKDEPEKICKLYLENLKYINNWDLIDISAWHIVPQNVNKSVLRELAKSDYLWANRAAMVSTLYFIKQGDYSLTLEFAKKFMLHSHHLMHKASGWMLREVGKKDEKVLREFLSKYEDKMPSVMRSYAKEKLKSK